MPQASTFTAAQAQAIPYPLGAVITTLTATYSLPVLKDYLGLLSLTLR